LESGVRASEEHVYETINPTAGNAVKARQQAAKYGPKRTVKLKYDILDGMVVFECDACPFKRN